MNRQEEKLQHEANMREMFPQSQTKSQPVRSRLGYVEYHGVEISFYGAALHRFLASNVAAQRYSNEEIARWGGFEVATVEKALTALVQAELVTIEEDEAGRRLSPYTAKACRL